MNLKLDRIINIATLIAALTAIVLVLRKPAPVAPPPAPPAVQQLPAANQSSGQPQPPQQPASVAVSTVAAPVHATAPSGTGVVLQAVPPRVATPARPALASGSGSSPNTASKDQGDSEAISSALGQMLGGVAGALTPDSNVGSEPVIKDQQVTMEGDIIHGKFLMEINGKDVWVTISGHMGEKDGYATFDPTEFKVGDMNVPVELVNPALQKELEEQHDRLKLPDNSVQ